MYYTMQIKDFIRVPPTHFDLDTKSAVIKEIKKKYDGYISSEMGIVIDVVDVDDIAQGRIIAGDGAAYFETTFSLVTFKPELQEVISGRIRDLADFGAFITLGPIEGMIHISQTMDDFVSFSKDKVLSGKETGRSLKINDLCNARIIAVSYKDITNPKIGLTMRQQGLGKSEWSKEKSEKAES